jgi:hypothetical protein
MRAVEVPATHTASRSTDTSSSRGSTTSSAVARPVTTLPAPEDRHRSEQRHRH